jgi:hypothetical protein
MSLQCDGATIRYSLSVIHYSGYRFLAISYPLFRKYLLCAKGVSGIADSGKLQADNKFKHLFVSAFG